MSTKTYSEFPASGSCWRSIRAAVTSVAAAMLVAACAADSPNSRAQRQSDIRAANELHSKLNSDHLYYYPHVTIRVDNGVARLSGYVWNVPALDHAKEVASSVPGITAVVDNLELEREGSR